MAEILYENNIPNDVQGQSAKAYQCRGHASVRGITVATMIGSPRHSNAGRRSRGKHQRRRAGCGEVRDEALDVEESLGFRMGLLSFYLRMQPIVARFSCGLVQLAACS